MPASKPTASPKSSKPPSGSKSPPSRSSQEPHRFSWPYASLWKVKKFSATEHQFRVPAENSWRLGKRRHSLQSNLMMLQPSFYSGMKNRNFPKLIKKPPKSFSSGCRNTSGKATLTTSPRRRSALPWTRRCLADREHTTTSWEPLQGFFLLSGSKATSPARKRPRPRLWSTGMSIASNQSPSTRPKNFTYCSTTSATTLCHSSHLAVLPVSAPRKFSAGQQGQIPRRNAPRVPHELNAERQYDYERVGILSRRSFLRVRKALHNACFKISPG